MNGMARRNVIAGVGLLLLGVVYAVLTGGLPDRTIPNTPGPSFFPWVVGVSFLVLAAALLVQGLRQRNVGEPATAPGGVRPVEPQPSRVYRVWVPSAAGNCCAILAARRVCRELGWKS